MLLRYLENNKRIYGKVILRAPALEEYDVCKNDTLENWSEMIEYLDSGKNYIRDGMKVETSMLEDYFKFPLTRSNGKEDTSRPLAWDSVTGPSYITYLDVYGNVKEAKYINNGKADDMLRDERQRYIAEVAEADKILSNAIDIYQKENTQENWLRVKDAMSKRIQVDKKYRVLENQKENTINTLKETVDETLDKYGRPKRKERTREDDDEDEWFTRGRH